MHIFIGNLPADTSLLDLQHFLGNHEMNVHYSSHSHDNLSDSSSHFLLIKTDSDESANKLISEINGKLFHGVPVEARRLIERSGQQEWDGQERRNEQMDLELLFTTEEAASKEAAE
jgi:hypothetical protein